MNICAILWGETLALFFVFSVCRSLKAMVSDGDGFLEAIWHGIVGQLHWHVSPEHLAPIAWISDAYLIILGLATIISYIF